MKNKNEVFEYKGGINTNEFTEWAKKVFKNPKRSGKRWCVVGLNFLKGYRKNYGDDEFYLFLNSVNIGCGKKEYRYIKKFLKNYKKQ